MIKLCVSIVLAVGLAACSTSTGGTTPGPTVTVVHTETVFALPQSDTPASTTPPNPKPTHYPVHKTDFKIALRIKRQSCFGSAGCNITYEINPKYVGAYPLEGSFQITYAVTGGDSGPQINTFTIQNHRASFDSEENISTPSNPHLAAHVVSIQRT
jgi:hypothetical protein